jgi:hypothetical protein
MARRRFALVARLEHDGESAGIGGRLRHVEEPLGELQPHLSGERRALVARSLFSAVHGMVMLGLEEKLQTVPPESLREQITFIISAIGRGMLAEARDAAQR